ncbi:Hypothetical predicted protein [Scomber scombrus]|uniref:Uncharacterized protein n=1 Tax=Scomber scombrus TaxID=13677 RepID=A0AAV1QF12_SCOSC
MVSPHLKVCHGYLGAPVDSAGTCPLMQSANTVAKTPLTASVCYHTSPCTVWMEDFLNFIDSTGRKSQYLVEQGSLGMITGSSATPHTGTSFSGSMGSWVQEIGGLSPAVVSGRSETHSLTHRGNTLASYLASEGLLVLVNS